MKSYYSFIYLDENSINSLYSQIFNDITERNLLHSNTDNTDLCLNAKLLTIFGADATYTEGSLTSEATKMVISTARKAQLIINHFRDENLLHIQNIINNNQPFEESLLFVGKSTFFLSDIFDKKSGSSIFYKKLFCDEQRIYIDENSIFILESGNTNFIHRHCIEYMNTDDYYKMNLNKNEKYGIMMHISNSKMKKDIRHLTWSIEVAKSFNFFVFGELIKSSEQYYKIIPFAIWQ